MIHIVTHCIHISIERIIRITFILRIFGLAQKLIMNSRVDELEREIHFLHQAVSRLIFNIKLKLNFANHFQCLRKVKWMIVLVAFIVFFTDNVKMFYWIVK